MEPKEDDITKQWVTSNLSGSFKKYMAGIDTAVTSDAISAQIVAMSKMLDNNEIVTEYVKDDILYAVKEQIDWAVKMLKYAKYRKNLSLKEITVLKKIRNEGNYLESEKPLLNEILTRYQDD